MNIILAIIIATVIVVVFIFGLKVLRRNQKMAKWAVSLSFSENQLKVLEELAAAEHIRKVPEKDPLDLLTAEERGELLYFCSPSGPPQTLVHGGERWWGAFAQRAKSMGFTEDQATILAGIEYNRLHPKYRSKI